MRGFLLLLADMSNRFPWKLAIWYAFFVGLVFGLQAVRYHHHSFFYLFPHFDKFLHACAGIACGIFGWILINLLLPNASTVQKFLIVLGMAIVVGIGWEILERFFPLLNVHIMKFNPVDTATDVISDILGGLIAFTYKIV